jgi:hypothetical protein
MKELCQAIAKSSIEQQVSLLPQALEHGESGIITKRERFRN